MSHTNRQARPMGSSQPTRRQLMAIGVTASIAGTVTPATRVHATDVATLLANDGKDIVLTGRIYRRGHLYNFINPRGEVMVRVFARDLNNMPPEGPAQIRGKLQIGKFSDAVIDDLAYAILLDAVPA